MNASTVVMIFAVLMALMIASCSGYRDSYEAVQRGDCGLTCPAGQVKAPLIPEYKAVTKGCGPKGEHNVMAAKHDLVNCCHTHESCYFDCTNTKEQCDVAFEDCMTKQCRASNNVPECNRLATQLYMSTELFGCDYYTTSQSEACNCKEIDPQSPTSQKDEL